MTRHAVAVYKVTVNENRNPTGYRRLGDIDEAGTSVLKSIEPGWAKLNAELPDDSDLDIGVIEQLPGLKARTQAGVVYHRGEKGVRSDVHVDTGIVHRLRHNYESVRVAAMLDIQSPDHQLGFLGVYIPSKRGVSSPLRRALRTAFLAKHRGELVLKIDPVIPKQVLQKAIAQNGLLEVELRAFRRPQDRFADAGGWVAGDDLSTIRTIISPTKGRKVRRDPIDRWLNSGNNAADLLTFEGATYDEILVRVEVDGRQHTVNLGDPEHGRALVLDVDEPPQTSDGEPTSAGLRSVIEGAIETVTRSA